MKRNWKVLYFN